VQGLLGLSNHGWDPYSPEVLLVFVVYLQDLNEFDSGLQIQHESFEAAR
jgi:hypothetical protein